MDQNINKKIIRLSKSCISSSEKKAVIDVLEREYLGMGTDVQIFEDLLSKFFGKSAVCTINGTAALHLALEACGIGKNDTVLVPSLTYIASFQSISATGARPIACDINEKSLLLDLNDAQKRISPNTKAIMPVHYTGGVGDLNSIYDFANQNNLRVIEDAAHAFGTIYKGNKIGSIGDIVCFSFDGIKNITCGEGGAILTDDKKIIQKVRNARLLGVEKDTEKRYSGKRSLTYNASNQGWRYHMSNIMAAIGIEQLNRFPNFARKRQTLAKKYDQLFAKEKRITIIQHDYNNVVPHIYVVRINKLKNRELLQKKLLKKGIEVGYHYHPNHWLSYYENKKEKSLNVTDAIFPELLSLPLHPDLNHSDVKYVVSELIALIN